MSGFDLVLANALVVDGTADATRTPGDIGVSLGRISAVGDLSERARDATVDVGGLVVAPGFIDTHTHAELSAFQERPSAQAPTAQGITTILTGSDGFGWVGLSDEDRLRWWEDSAAIYGAVPDPPPRWATPSEFLADARRSARTSLVPMVPHGNVRAAVMGTSPEKPGANELDAMCGLVREWLDAGAVGMASGLDYLPGRYASTEEIVRLCEVVAARGGVYASHLRYFELGREGAWQEAAEIGRRAGVPIRIAHERLDEEGTSLLDEIAADIDATIDSYLYPAGCTSAAYHVPPEMLADGVMALARRLRTDSQLASDLAAHLEQRLTSTTGQKVIVAATTSGSLEGRTLDSLADERGEAVGEIAVFLLREEMPCSLMVYVWQAPDETWDATVERTLGHPRAMIATDGIYHGSFAHPRSFGAFPRVLGQMSRDRSLLTLGEAVHKMTGLPAAAYGLGDRGLIEPGRRADLVVFDPETVDGPADFDNPKRAPVGIEQVFVGGRSVWRSRP